MYVCNWTENLQGIIDYLALAWQKNFFPRILITGIRGMTFEFEYLSEFEFIFENNLGSWSGDQKLAFDEKKRMSKISCKYTFKTTPQILYTSLLYCGIRFKQGCGAGTGTGRNRIHLGSPTPEPEPYSEYGSGSGYKEIKQKTQKNLLKF